MLLRLCCLSVLPALPHQAGSRPRLGLRGVNARLLLRPLMALELVVFELVLALPALRVDKDLSLSWSKGQCFQCAPSVAG